MFVKSGKREQKEGPSDPDAVFSQRSYSTRIPYVCVRKNYQSFLKNPTYIVRDTRTFSGSRPDIKFNIRPSTKSDIRPMWNPNNECLSWYLSMYLNFLAKEKSSLYCSGIKVFCIKYCFLLFQCRSFYVIKLVGLQGGEKERAHLTHLLTTRWGHRELRCVEKKKVWLNVNKYKG